MAKILDDVIRKTTKSPFQYSKSISASDVFFSADEVHGLSSPWDIIKKLIVKTLGTYESYFKKTFHHSLQNKFMYVRQAINFHFV